MVLPLAAKSAGRGCQPHSTKTDAGHALTLLEKLPIKACLPSSSAPRTLQNIHYICPKNLLRRKFEPETESQNIVKHSVHGPKHGMKYSEKQGRSCTRLLISYTYIKSITAISNISMLLVGVMGTLLQTGCRQAPFDCCHLILLSVA